MDKKTTILAIETSCDETAMSVCLCQNLDNEYRFEVVSNTIASQIKLHSKWGGVYPELASRAHLEAMIPVLSEALTPIGELEGMKKQIDLIAVTKEPGLIGSLLMGTETAYFLSKYYKKPLLDINHLEGHIYSAFAKLDCSFDIAKKDLFPILSLVVSGGHTSLILMNDHLQYETIGQTIDDAAGEAFDKVARIMGLGYPGGPIIEKEARNGDEKVYDLPRGLEYSGDFNFSFSGLKTSVLYKTKDVKTQKEKEYDKKDMAASFQKAVCDILIKKTLAAAKKYNPKTVILCGGVSANGYLRERFSSKLGKTATKPTVLIPPKSLSTDNAVGIAIAGAIRFLKTQK